MSAQSSLTSTPQVILGTGVFGIYPSSAFSSAEPINAALAALKSHNLSRIDTARTYPNTAKGTAEQVLGLADLQGFTIDTKVWSTPGQHTPNNLQRSVDESLALLGVDKVNILYLHFRDTETPLAEVCSGIDAIYKQGKFAQFGVSNFRIEHLQEMIDICEREGYVKPTVYQGQYNALARNPEHELIPFLRKHEIAFYAYSPGAGGAFKKDSTRMKDEGVVGEMWRGQYGAAKDVIEKVGKLAEVSGINGHAVALRWALHHSILQEERGDAVIIGARTLDQLKQTLLDVEGGELPENVVAAVEDAWTEVKDTAPPYTLMS